MNKTIEKGRTLLVDGPASVSLVSGKAAVFGSIVRNASKIVIREGKRLPFWVEDKAIFSIELGEGSKAEDFEGDTIPSSWNIAFEELTKIDAKPITVLVLGKIDSGKTSLCTYLLNRLLREKKKVAVLDGDLGQSDIGPPCAVSYTFVTKPVTDLFNLVAKNAFFVGLTSPSTTINRVIQGMTDLKKEILTGDPDFVLVNTDGWTEGEDALYYKVKLIEELKPDSILGLQQTDELTMILNTLERFAKITLEPPRAIGERNTEKRKNLRELGYVKYLKNPKTQSLPLSWLRIEESDLLGLDVASDKNRGAAKLYQLLGMKPLHLVELKDRISVIIGKSRWIDAENIKKVEDYTKKKVVISRKGEEEGLLLAAYDAKKKFLGIGVVQEIDYMRKTLKISTPVTEGIAIIVLGKVKLDRNLREVTTSFPD